MIRNTIFYLLVLLSPFASAQTNKTLTIDFISQFNGELLIQGKNYAKDEKDSLSLNAFRFYISGIELLQNNLPVFREKDSYHLIDHTEKNSTTLSLQVPENIHFDALRFTLGIDSLTNVSGVMGGDLDPTNGMYWTWQSGYINIKLEGRASNSSNPRKEYSFHLGGYMGNDASAQQVTLTTKKTDHVVIACDLKTFFDELDLSAQSNIMSPGKEAVYLSQLMAKAFLILQP